VTSVVGSIPYNLYFITIALILILGVILLEVLRMNSTNVIKQATILPFQGIMVNFASEFINKVVAPALV
jgi:hypothetical protein